MDNLPAENDKVKVLDSWLKVPAENQSLSKMVLKECITSFRHSAEMIGTCTQRFIHQVDYISL